MILLYEHASAPVLTGDVRDHRIAAGSGAGARVQARGLDHVVPVRAPPVWRAGQGEGFAGGALRAEKVRAVHGRGAVREDDAIEDEGDVHRGAVLPVVGELHGDRGEGGAEDPLVHGGVIAPVVCVEVGEDNPSRRWQFRLAAWGDIGVEGRVRAPKAKCELGRPMVIMCDAIRPFSKRALKLGRVLTIAWGH